MKKSLIIILLITCMIFSLSVVAAAEIDGNGDTSVEINNIDQNIINPVDTSVSSSKNVSSIKKTKRQNRQYCVLRIRLFFSGFPMSAV